MSEERPQYPSQSGLEPTEPMPKTAPAVNPPRWRGRKTAVAAALAIGLSSAGALAAAATVEQGSTGGEGGGTVQRGGGHGFPGQGNLQNQNQQQVPRGQPDPQQDHPLAPDADEEGADEQTT